MWSVDMLGGEHVIHLLARDSSMVKANNEASPAAMQTYWNGKSVSSSLSPYFLRLPSGVKIDLGLITKSSSATII